MDKLSLLIQAIFKETDNYFDERQSLKIRELIIDYIADKELDLYNEYN